MNKISEIAKSYLGKTEISGNKGFNDKEFEKKMRAVGFYTGAPWCLFFARLVWKEAGEDFEMIEPSALRSMLKNSKAGNWNDKPKVGAIAIFRTFKGGKPQTTGHGAIVTEIKDETNYTTIDGNTTDKGGREGIMVANRFRHLTSESWRIENGLRLMGFIYPKD